MHSHEDHRGEPGKCHCGCEPLGSPTGTAINKPMGVKHTVLPPDGSHKESRIRGVTPCVGYKDTNIGDIIASPAATAAGCSNIEFVRTPNAYAVGRQNVDFGVRQPGAYRFDMALSKNFGIPEGSTSELLAKDPVDRTTHRGIFNSQLS